MPLSHVKKRDSEIVEFDVSNIRNAILKAYKATSQDFSNEIDPILKGVLADLEEISSKLLPDTLITVEQIQDVVEKVLMKFNKYEVAKAYILYRNQQSVIRQEKHQQQLEKLEQNKLMVTKNNGTQEPFDMSKVKQTYDRIANELVGECPFSELELKLKQYMIDWIKTSEITKLITKAAIDLISVDNIKWQFIAGRFAMIDIYKKASRNRECEVSDLFNPAVFKSHFDDYMRKWLYYKDFYKYYSDEDVLELGKHLNPDTDMEYNYTTVLMYSKRYLLNPNKIVREIPQEMYMVAAMFLAIPESKETRLQKVLKIYDYCSKQKISLPTPTLLNARTNFHQLSSCFKFNIDDDLRAIYHGIENMAQISKFGWGIWVYLGHIRSKWGSIRGVKGVSGWVTPWVRVINDTAIAVNQLGARAGSISPTLDIWHKDIFDFLDLQTETWDIRRKAFDIFPSVSIPDLFMKRVEANEDWTLFDPKEVSEKYWIRLEDHFGAQFDEFYQKLEQDNSLELKEVISAKELFKKFLKSVVETWMPYVFFRDTVNKYNPNKHAGNVYSTQLCTEIAQNCSSTKFNNETVDEDGNVSISYKPWDFVVCNLASINVAKVHQDDDINDVIDISMRILDNVITLNFYPIKEAELTAQKYRSVGLGFLWVAEYLATNGFAYDTKEARQEIDRLFEKYAYATLKSSSQLAQERGHYPLFPGSDWSKWLLFGRDASWYAWNTQMPEKWATLIEDIKKHGVRFSYHLSPAPNTSTSLVVGTTAGVLPIYKKYFVDNNSIAPSVNVAPGLTKRNFWLYKEYVNMQMPDVIDMVSVIQKWIDQSISFEWMINPMVVSPAELYSYYVKAWKQEIKTVYYVRSMSMEVSECISCSG